MKRILAVFLWVVANAEAIDITVSGTWSRPIDASDLISGAGSNLNSQYESAAGVMTVSISNLGLGTTWRVKARRSDNTWDSRLTLAVKRTSNGSGLGSISGGTTYIDLTTSDTELFTGLLARSNIGLQLKLTGMSKDISPAVYSTAVIFTVTP